MNLKVGIVLFHHFIIIAMRIIVCNWNGRKFQIKLLIFRLLWLQLIYLLMFYWKLLIGYHCLFILIIKRKLIWLLIWRNQFRKSLKIKIKINVFKLGAILSHLLQFGVCWVVFLTNANIVWYWLRKYWSFQNKYSTNSQIIKAYFNTMFFLYSE